MVLHYLFLQVLNWHQDAACTGALSAVHFRRHDLSQSGAHVILPCESYGLLSRLTLEFPSVQLVRSRRLE